MHCAMQCIFRKAFLLYGCRPDSVECPEAAFPFRINSLIRDTRGFKVTKRSDWKTELGEHQIAPLPLSHHPATHNPRGATA